MAVETSKSSGAPRAIIPAQARRNRPRRKAIVALEDENSSIDYKNPELLRFFISERGKLLPARMTGVSPKQQRSLARAIKRARMIALLPFAVNE